MKPRTRTQLTGAMLDSAPPDKVDELLSHERESNEDESLLTSLMSQLKDIAAENELLKARLAKEVSPAAEVQAPTLDKPPTATSFTPTRYKELLDRCKPLQIGGRGGTHPAALDIHLTHHNDGLVIAWLPVPLYPVAKPPDDPSKAFYTTRDGEKVPNRELGRTQIRESFASHTILTKSGTPIEVGMTGLAIVNLARGTPAEIADRLNRRETKRSWDTLSNEHSDGLTLAESLTESATSPATPPPAIGDAFQASTDDAPFITLNTEPPQ